MSRELFAALLACSLAGSTTGLAPASANAPTWLQAKLTELQRRPGPATGRLLWRTTYEGRAVYYLEPACCDIPSELYDEQGVLLCYPTGGFAGGDGRCPGFELNEASAILVGRGARQP